MVGFAKPNAIIGYTQVERNHMSGEVTGQILAQLPVDKATMGKVIENGRFAKYDYANKKVNLTGAGEWMMIYNEEKLPDPRKQNHKDFAMVAKDYTDEEIVPRLISTVLGDVFTTNAIHTADSTSTYAKYTVADINALSDTSERYLGTLTAGDTLVIGEDGYLTNETISDYDGPEFQVAKVYNLADTQPAVKVMRIK